MKRDYKNFLETLKSFKDYKYIDSFLKNGRKILVVLNSYDEDFDYMKKRILKIAKDNNLFIKKVTDYKITVSY